MGQQLRKEEKPKTKKRMFGILLLSLPGLLTAAPASLASKHVVKAPSPIYTPPVYNEHTGQGINHGYGQGLGFGHGHGAAYGQGYANGAHAPDQTRPCVHWISSLYSGSSHCPSCWPSGGPPCRPSGWPPCWPPGWT